MLTRRILRKQEKVLSLKCLKKISVKKIGIKQFFGRRGGLTVPIPFSNKREVKEPFHLKIIRTNVQKFLDFFFFSTFFMLISLKFVFSGDVLTKDSQCNVFHGYSLDLQKISYGSESRAYLFQNLVPPWILFYRRPFITYGNLGMFCLFPPT